ncbi:MAG TPA: MFS transporter [Nitriliruptorales bacterium]|jgi:MFS family permease
MSDSQRIVRSYYAISGVYTLSASLIWGVNTLFLLDAGLDFFEVFVANAAYSLGTVLFEIPTGVVADTLGRRTSFLLSVGVLSASTLGYVALSMTDVGVIPYVLVSILLGLGFTFYSGAVDAWLVDALATTDWTDTLDHVFARASMFTAAAMLIGTVGGGLLGQLDLAIPFLARAGLLAVVFVLAWSRMYDIGYEPRPLNRHNVVSEMTTTGRNGMRTALGTPDLRLFAIAGAFTSGFFIWGWYAWQPHFLDLFGDPDAVWVAGVVSALVAASMMAGNLLVGRVHKYCHKRTTLLLWATAGIATGGAIIGFVEVFWVAVPALLLMTMALGVTMPVRTAYLHASVPSQHRATAVSTDSMVSGVGQVGGQLGLGALGRGRGEPAGYLVGAAMTAVTLPLLWLARRVGSPADQIRGTLPESSCAADGLPEIAMVSGTHAGFPEDEPLVEA